MDPTPASTKPPPILKLDPDVVNKIAAGEVIQRPVNALKEMMENSLDAGSSSIVVTCKDGGMKLIEIKDDGHGIRNEDFPILCERFTTSKLRKYDDLSTIATFGFRGEALASISHVARVTITSKTGDSPCAYRAKFIEGKMQPDEPGKAAKPTPCAGNQGTTISVEDLFYNMDARRRAFKTTSEQYQRILDVVTRYAIHYGGREISFTCKKYGAASPDIHTQRRASQLDNIRTAFGAALGRELLELVTTAVELDPSQPNSCFSARGFISNANYSSKRSVFILFINDRLVDSSNMKRMVDNVYSPILPKGSHSFVYLSLVLPPEILDVNVHPTKREVHFLHEDLIMDTLRSAISGLLNGANSSRTFYTQSSLASLARSSNAASAVDVAQPAAAMVGDVEEEEEDVIVRTKRSAKRKSAVPFDAFSAGSSTAPPAQSKSRRDDKLIRVDASVRTINAFLVKDGNQSLKAKEDTTPVCDISAPSTLNIGGKTEGVNHESDTLPIANDSNGDDFTAVKAVATTGMQHKKPVTFVETSSQYLSVKNLIAAIKCAAHKGMASLLQHATFVGMVDAWRSLVQFETKLILINHIELSREAFFQMAIRRFEVTPRLKLANPVCVREFVRASLDTVQSGWTPEDGPKDALTTEVVELLQDKRALLGEYFNIGFTVSDDHSGELLLTHLPELIENHIPVPEALPLFLLRLATECEWDEEQGCFESISLELGRFYGTLPPLEPGVPKTQRNERAQHVLTNILLPSFRWALLPRSDMASDGTIVQVASLEKLYKVFERC